MAEVDSSPQKKIHTLIIDYGMGNLRSVQNAMEKLGCHVTLSTDPRDMANADAIILPGVGAFGTAMENLRRLGFVDALNTAVLENKKPILGICLGMQLLAADSDERGLHAGLGLIPGHVRRVPVTPELHLPHMGWNSLHIKKSAPLFENLREGDSFFFVHSYRFECDEPFISATCDYGVTVVAAVQSDNIFGVQFHPERSQRKGLRLLSNFLAYVQTTELREA